MNDDRYDIDDQLMRLARAAAIRDRGPALNRAERRVIEHDARRRARRALRIARKTGGAE